MSYYTYSLYVVRTRIYKWTGQTPMSWLFEECSIPLGKTRSTYISVSCFAKPYVGKFKDCVHTQSEIKNLIITKRIKHDA